MEFLATEVKQINRHVEPSDDKYLLKYEVMTIEVKLIGSGDTRDFKSGDVAGAVLDALQPIKPK